MKHFYFAIILFIFGGSVFGSPSGPENRYNIIYNFEKDWSVYDQDLEVYTPYVGLNKENSKVYSIKITLSDFPGGFLLIKTPTKGNFLFLDNHLKKTLPANKWVVYSIRELINETKKSETTLSIFGSSKPEDNIVFIGYPATKTTEIISKTSNNFLSLTPRSTAHINSSLVLVFFINILMLSFIASNYTKAFRKYYSLKDLAAFIPKENSFLVNKPMDRPNMMFIIMLSLISGFILLMAQANGFSVFKENFFFQNGTTFGILTVNFFKICLVVFISYIVKYFYINLIGKLFNIKKIVDIHYFKIIQTSIYYFSAVLILLLIGFNTHQKTAFEFKYLFTSVLVVFYLLRTILIYFTINRAGNIKTLYLISYLCIVEVFPIVLGMRILL
ncbi:MAG TPA: DUF4271 domain-containing protein [Leadbetterella sp.]|nr:DUF4271 domain-containing protein [Leadbetterella sp.]